MGLDLSNCTKWNHHRSGWEYCINAIRCLHDPNGILFVDYLEQVIKERSRINRPWIGVLHNAINHPAIMTDLYLRSLDLATIMQTPIWKRNLSNCVGIFCLSTENAEYVKQFVSVPVEVIYHATEFPAIKFDKLKFLDNENKKLIMIGHWMRDFQAIYDLKTKFNKCILRGVGNAFDYSKVMRYCNINDSVSIIPRLDNDAYDELLSKNVVFLKLWGSSANNTIVESMVRATPIFVNRLPALEEYLGKDYPLFYDEEIRAIDEHDILNAHKYLSQLGFVEKLRGESFLKSILNSKIYKLITRKIFI